MSASLVNVGGAGTSDDIALFIETEIDPGVARTLTESPLAVVMLSPSTSTKHQGMSVSRRSTGSTGCVVGATATAGGSHHLSNNVGPSAQPPLYGSPQSGSTVAAAAAAALYFTPQQQLRRPPRHQQPDHQQYDDAALLGHHDHHPPHAQQILVAGEMDEDDAMLADTTTTATSASAGLNATLGATTGSLPRLGRTAQEAVELEGEAHPELVSSSRVIAGSGSADFSSPPARPIVVTAIPSPASPASTTTVLPPPRPSTRPAAASPTDGLRVEGLCLTNPPPPVDVAPVVTTTTTDDHNLGNAAAGATQLEAPAFTPPRFRDPSIGIDSADLLTLQQQQQQQQQTSTLGSRAVTTTTAPVTSAAIVDPPLPPVGAGGKVTSFRRRFGGQTSPANVPPPPLHPVAEESTSLQQQPAPTSAFVVTSCTPQNTMRRRPNASGPSSPGMPLIPASTAAATIAQIISTAAAHRAASPAVGSSGQQAAPQHAAIHSGRVAAASPGAHPLGFPLFAAADPSTLTTGASSAHGGATAPQGSGSGGGSQPRASRAEATNSPFVWSRMSAGSGGGGVGAGGATNAERSIASHFMPQVGGANLGGSSGVGALIHHHHSGAASDAVSPQAAGAGGRSVGRQGYSAHRQRGSYFGGGSTGAAGVVHVGGAHVPSSSSHPHNAAQVGYELSPLRLFPRTATGTPASHLHLLQSQLKDATASSPAYHGAHFGGSVSGAGVTGGGGGAGSPNSAAIFIPPPPPQTPPEAAMAAALAEAIERAIEAEEEAAALRSECARLRTSLEHQRQLAEESEVQRAAAEDRLQSKIIEVVGLGSRLEESKRFIRQLKKEGAASRERTLAVANAAAGLPLTPQQIDRVAELRATAALKAQENRFTAMVRERDERIAALSEMLDAATEAPAGGVNRLLEVALIRGRRLADECGAAHAQLESAQRREHQLQARLLQLQTENKEQAAQMQEAAKNALRALAQERQYSDELVCAVESLREELQCKNDDLEWCRQQLELMGPAHRFFHESASNHDDGEGEEEELMMNGDRGGSSQHGRASSLLQQHGNTTTVGTPSGGGQRNGSFTSTVSQLQVPHPQQVPDFVGGGGGGGAPVSNLDHHHRDPSGGGSSSISGGGVYTTTTTPAAAVAGALTATSSGSSSLSPSRSLMSGGGGSGRGPSPVTSLGGSSATRASTTPKASPVAAAPPPPPPPPGGPVFASSSAIPNNNNSSSSSVLVNATSPSTSAIRGGSEGRPPLSGQRAGSVGSAGNSGGGGGAFDPAQRSRGNSSLSVSGANVLLVDPGSNSVVRL